MNFLSLLTILFIGLKLSNHIDWSWFFVLSPLLVPWFLTAIIWIFASIALGIMWLFEGKKRK